MLAMSSTTRLHCLFLLALAIAVPACTMQRVDGSVIADTLLMHPVADDHFTMPDGTVLPVRTWLPPDGSYPQTVVLALHGFNDSRDAWALPAPVFAAGGIAVFAPDQRGFGDTPTRGGWPGGAALVDDADTMARALHQRYPAARLFVMGESMGGAVALDLAARANGPPVDGYVLLAPAVWGRSEQGVVLATTLWLANGVAPGYRITSADVPTSVKVTASDNRDALLALINNPLTIHGTQVSTLAGLVDLMDSAQAAAPALHGRVFVAYGNHDMLVPASAMGVAWAHLPDGVRRAVYPNGYHLLMRDKDRQAVIGDVMAWMQTPGAFLPSGADMAAGAWTSIHHPGGGLAF